jgi:hypothetical protein
VIFVRSVTATVANYIVGQSRSTFGGIACPFYLMPGLHLFSLCCSVR